jgi:hypothetical protein
LEQNADDESDRRSEEGNRCFAAEDTGGIEEIVERLIWNECEL